ncbi:MAG: hypothetical protein JW810_02650 [Sedimentisphaerales bacterium]|nr:hypothetical protein [Sedimentisphaerales bacterium]
MKTTIAVTAVGVFLFGASILRADPVELDLLALGCPQEFPGSGDYWESDFDLGVAFSDISHVYIDWTGGITAGLIQNYHPQTFEPVGDPFPEEVGIYVYMGWNPDGRYEEIWGDVSTYPNPDVFDTVMEIELHHHTTWSDWLDGRGTVTVGYTRSIVLFGGYIDYGSVVLDEASLIIDGTVIPEPVGMVLLAAGWVGLRGRGNRRLVNGKRTK